MKILLKRRLERLSTSFDEAFDLCMGDPKLEANLSVQLAQNIGLIIARLSEDEDELQEASLNIAGTIFDFAMKIREELEAK